MPKEAGIEPWTVATLTSAAGRSNHFVFDTIIKNQKKDKIIIKIVTLRNQKNANNKTGKRKKKRDILLNEVYLSARLVWGGAISISSHLQYLYVHCTYNWVQC